MYYNILIDSPDAVPCGKNRSCVPPTEDCIFLTEDPIQIRVQPIARSMDGMSAGGGYPEGAVEVVDTFRAEEN
jgi:hypothetical protein